MAVDKFIHLRTTLGFRFERNSIAKLWSYGSKALELYQGIENHFRNNLLCFLPFINTIMDRWQKIILFL